MPLGFQERFHYGDRMRANGVNSGTPWSYSGVPLIGYESVYTYRSGANAKKLIQGGSYNTSVTSGRDLESRLMARKQYLESLVKQILVPQNGSPSVFSTTDEGHPFATFKVRTHNPYGRVRVFTNTNQWGEWDVCPTTALLPYPDLTNPFGVGVVSGDPMSKRTYFTWPATLAGGGNNFPVAQQVVPSTLKTAIGAGVIASSNPWAPKASLAQTIVELLRGDVPSVVKNLRKHLHDLQSLKKTVGSDWLNIQFGWVPLVSDLMKTVETLFKLHELLFMSEAHRRQRSGYLGNWSRMETSFGSAGRVLYWTNPVSPASAGSTFVKDVTGSVASAPGSIPSLDASFSKTVITSADFRFSARFHRGAVPNGAELGYIERAAELFGLEFTPSVLWELTPWTWLLDWASSLGATAQNLSTLDWSNVLLDYAYLTFVVKTEASASVTLNGNSYSSGTGTFLHGSRFLSQHWVTTEKVREQASPFGFGVSWTGLSPLQLSILASLGMSRGR